MKFVATTTAYQLDLQASVVYYAELSVRMARMMKEPSCRFFRTPCVRLPDNRMALDQDHEALNLGGRLTSGQQLIFVPTSVCFRALRFSIQVFVTNHRLTI